MLTAFIVVKHAGRDWNKYFVNNPKLYFQPRQASCHSTYTGKICKVKPYYLSEAEAGKAKDACETFNPEISYGVCKTLIRPEHLDKDER